MTVKVRAEAELDDTAIEQKIKEDTYYVICTSDVERDWTMAELIGVYKKQSVVERNWDASRIRNCLSTPYIWSCHQE